MKWKPILEGELAERAWVAVERIAKDLASFTPTDFSLAGGSAGISLFFHQMSLARPNDGYEQQTERFFLHAADALANETTNASLYAGFPGVAMVGQLISPADADEEDPYEAIDDALLVYLDEDEWALDYDLIGGLAGFGLAALERIERESAQKIAGAVLSHLKALAKETPQGVTWWTSPQLMISDVAKEFPDGYYNYGLAHGVPGVIAVLARMLLAGFEEATVRPLLEGAVSWLLANKSKPKAHAARFEERLAGYSHFSAYAYSPDDVLSCRTAWCYGDPGVAVALWLAGEAGEREDWKREAIELARFASSLTMEQALIQDVPLCHGASGLAHIWNRLYQETGVEELRSNAVRWFGCSLSMLKEGEGFAGVQDWGRTSTDQEIKFRPNPDFLNGAAGVGLSLLGGLTQHEPQWDRVLLLSHG